MNDVQHLITDRMRAVGITTAAALHSAMTPRPSSQAVRAWVYGRSVPAPRWWAPLARALGTTTEALSEAERRNQLLAAAVQP